MGALDQPPATSGKALTGKPEDMIGGIRSMRMLVAAAALGMLDGPALREPIHRIPADPERERYREQERARREKHAHQRRAQERKDRREREAEMREHLLRQSIAEGRDDRAGKYLHAAARRRREAALTAQSAPTATEA
jgi:hypothetical protein